MNDEIPNPEEWDKLSNVDKITWHIEKEIGNKIHKLTKRYISAFNVGNYLENWANNFGLSTFISFEKDLRKAIQGDES
jgi:hypothetical protein